MICSDHLLRQDYVNDNNNPGNARAFQRIIKSHTDNLIVPVRKVGKNLHRTCENVIPIIIFARVF